MKNKFTLAILASFVFLKTFLSEVVCANVIENSDIETSVSTTTSNSLPKFAFETLETSEESDQKIRTLVKDGAQSFYTDPREARESFVEALSLAKAGKPISEYDYLWTRYGLLKSSFESGTGNFGPGSRQDFMKLAAQTLEYLDQQTSTGIWSFTELGAFQKENYRFAGNGLAWEQLELSESEQDLETALNNVEYAIRYIEDTSHYYIWDTKVRILMELKRNQEAFEIVNHVLSEEPDFGDFQDFKNNQDYQQWLKTESVEN